MAGEAVGAGCSTLSCVTASRVQAVEACYVVEWLGAVRLGGQGMVSSGAASFGRVRHGEAV